jgi:hypothetical protein
MHAMNTCTLHPAAERLPLAAVQLRWPIAVRQAITAAMLNLSQYSRKILGRSLHLKGESDPHQASLRVASRTRRSVAVKGCHRPCLMAVT